MIEHELPFHLVQKSKLRLEIKAFNWDKQAIRSSIESKQLQAFTNFHLSTSSGSTHYYHLEILNQFKCMKDCQKAGEYISLNFKTILCEAHKD
jgi:hypothetical protein